MTDDGIARRERLTKSSDVTVLRAMIGFAARRLMQPETEALCGATYIAPTPRRRARSKNAATVTLANQLARIAWAMPRRGEPFAAEQLAVAAWSTGYPTCSADGFSANMHGDQAEDF